MSCLQKVSNEQLDKCDISTNLQMSATLGLVYKASYYKIMWRMTFISSVTNSKYLKRWSENIHSLKVHWMEYSISKPFVVRSWQYFSFQVVNSNHAISTKNCENFGFIKERSFPNLTKSTISTIYLRIGQMHCAWMAERSKALRPILKKNLVRKVFAIFYSMK